MSGGMIYGFQSTFQICIFSVAQLNTDNSNAGSLPIPRKSKKLYSGQDLTIDENNDLAETRRPGGTRHLVAKYADCRRAAIYRF